MHELCVTCGLWHPVESDPKRIPSPGYDYVSVEFKRVAPAPDEIDSVCRCEQDDDEVGSDVDDEDVEFDTPVRANPFEDERQTLDSAGTSRAIDTPNDIKHIVISPPGQKPCDVHSLVWKKFSLDTRKRHATWLIRLKSLPSTMMNWPLPKAVVEMVLRHAQAKNWAWSTIASTLSTIATALEELHVYGNTEARPQIRPDPYFKAASEKAQKNARVMTSLRPFNSEALSFERYRSIAETLKPDPATWILLHLTWWFAARLGDMRRVSPDAIQLDFSNTAASTVPIFATFTEGKGAFFWGPYTIHTRIPVDIAKAVLEYVRSRRNSREQHLFSTRHQEKLAKELRRLPGHTARSIRKGALNFLADSGVGNSNLCLVSGHKREDTLKRYLQWGQNDSDARKAALERSKLVEKHVSLITGAGTGASTRHPRWMGLYSAHDGKQGRRVRDPPKLFERKAPTAKDLGLPSAERDPSSKPSFHAVKNLSVVNFDALLDITQDAEVLNDLMKARQWMNGDHHYGISQMPLLAKAQIPLSRFTSEQMRILLETNKIVPWKDPIKSAVKGFTVFQENKNRDRPVFETLFNNLVDRAALPSMAYHSRLVNRQKLAGKLFFWEFDFKAWYDHFPLHPDALASHVLRVRAPVEWNGTMHDTFALTRVAMGSAFSAHIAQAVTWAILLPVLDIEGIEVVTMIDNVGIGGDDPTAFIRACRIFVDRCDHVRATLNERSTFPLDDAQLLAQAQAKAKCHTLLGEVKIQ
eukprot:PhM_4_TR1275/c0_g1_i10/m.84717